MRCVRYFVSTRKKQWRLLILCVMLATIGYVFWGFTQLNSPTLANKHQNLSKTYSLTKSDDTTSHVDDIKGVSNVLPRLQRTSMLEEKLWLRKIFKPTEPVKQFLTKPIVKKYQELSTDASLPLKVSYNVHIFYYPWYGNPRTDSKYVHWNHEYLPHWNKDIAAQYKKGIHIPPDDIGSDFYPKLGCYSSSDGGIIRDHMKQIRTSGAGVIVVSWYPKGKADQQGIPVDKLMLKILNIAAQFKLKVTIHIEPYKDRNEQTVRDDIVYIHKKYAKHPAFFKYKAKDNRFLPLLYVYDSYHTKPHEWANLLQPNGKYTIRNSPYDCVMISLMVEFDHRDYITIGGFDGFYTYFAVDGFTYGSRWNSWTKLKSFAVQTNSVFIPSVGPGYIDTSIRPWNSANTRSRENGDYYKKSFEAALSIQPPIISVTSFNEWHEGTQIEQAIPKSWNGYKYKDYSPHGSDYYLKLTRSFVEKFMK